MNKLQFYQYLHHPELLDERSLTDLEKILEEFPYFQSARLLQIKNHDNQGNVSYDRELKKTAIWITDRSRLFDLLDKRVLLRVDEDTLSIEKPDDREKDNLTIDFSELKNVTEFEEHTTKQNDELSQLIMSGAAQSGSFFNVDDKLDLNDFVNTFKKKKALEPFEKEMVDEKIQHRNNLIDAFISEQPRIVPEKSKDKIFEIKESINENEDADFITDTLARIYINQGKYEKAILAYDKLSLKYPEKNIYFAGQIQKIKELINNQ